MQQIIGVLRALGALGSPRLLRTTYAFWEALLCSGYSVAAWSNDSSVDRETRLFLKAAAGKAPFVEDALAELNTLTEVSCAGQVSQAMTLAAIEDSIVISL